MVEAKDIRITLGIVLRELRIQKGITQEQLSEKIGMQPQSITKIETGKSFVSSNALAKLSNFFEIDPYIFFTKNIRYQTKEDLDYIYEIRKMLPGFKTGKLRQIYNFLIILNK